MAPPTMAPPSRPAAMPAPTPSWALAGGVAVTSEPATVATVRTATRVLFMFLALLGDGASRAGVFSLHAHAVWNFHSQRKRANGQSKVNAHGAVTRESGLFQAGTRRRPPGSARYRWKD